MSDTDFELVFESSSAASLVLDAGFRIVAVNAAYLQTTMTRREQLLGRLIYDVFPDNPNDPFADGVRNLDASLQRVKQTLQSDVMLQKYDIARPTEQGGHFEERYWSVENAPVLGIDGGLRFIIHRVEDVTAFMKLKQRGSEHQRQAAAMQEHASLLAAEIFKRSQQLQATNAQLRQANSELAAREQQFADLNATLEQRVAARTAEAEERAEQLSILTNELASVEQRERRRLARLLHDHLQQLLVGAKLTLSGGLSGKPISLGSLRRLDGLLDESIAASRSLIAELSPPVLYDGGLKAALRWLARQVKEKHNLEVKLDLDPQLQDPAETFAVVLFEAARELLFNVVKHAWVNQAHVSLSTPTPGTLRLDVVDRGAGFHAPGNNAAGASDGFGLLNVRERVTHVGGILTVNSSPGRGTHVAITFRDDIKTNGNVASLPAPSDAAAQAEPPSDAAGPLRVLLADDHRLFREGIRMLLEAHSQLQIVGEAQNGREAVELAMSLRPDIVVMDITMPEMNGVEATRQICSRMPGTRIVALSMHRHDDMAALMLAAGASTYLLKDGPCESLVDAILACRTA